MRYPPLPLLLFYHVWVHQCNICVMYGLCHICRRKKQSTGSDLKNDPLTNLVPRQMIVYLSLSGKVAACYHHLLQVTKIRGGYGGGVGWGSVLCWIWEGLYSAGYGAPSEAQPLLPAYWLSGRKPHSCCDISI